MAVQAPLHLQGVFLVHQRHLVDSAVTAGAPEAFVYVDLVVEVDVVRKIMHADPLDGFAGGPAVADGLEELGVGPDLGVTVDTGLGGRDTCVARLLHRRVAVLALQSQSFHVMLVAERDGLIRPLALPGHPRRALQRVQGYAECDDDQAGQN
jgi:hypothetical protein